MLSIFGSYTETSCGPYPCPLVPEPAHLSLQLTFYPCLQPSIQLAYRFLSAQSPAADLAPYLSHGHLCLGYISGIGVTESSVNVCSICPVTCHLSSMIHPSNHPSKYPSIYPTIHPTTQPSTHPSIHPSTHQLPIKPPPCVNPV